MLSQAAVRAGLICKDNPLRHNIRHRVSMSIASQVQAGRGAGGDGAMISARSRPYCLQARNVTSLIFSDPGMRKIRGVDRFDIEP
jgi:hypothetical protein